MPTRIRCAPGTAAVTPTSWAFPEQANTFTVPGTTSMNTGLAMTAVTGPTSNTGLVTFRALGRVVWGPLAAQTISGTLVGQMRCMENNAGANATLAVSAKIVTPAGTDRGVLLVPTASDATTTPPEMPVSTTTPVNRPYQTATESMTLPLTSQTASDGDYLVIEWGFRCVSSAARTINTSVGNDNTSDLPITESAETQPLNPWWEFSQTLTLAAETPTLTPSETLPVAALVTLLVPLLPLSVTAAVGLLSTVTLVLSPLRPAATETVSTAETASVALRLGAVSLSTAVAVTDTSIVITSAEGALAVGPVLAALPVIDTATLRLPLLAAGVLTALGLTDGVTVRVPRLPLVLTESLVLGTTATVHVPLLRCPVTETVGVTASAIVVCTVEGLMQVGPTTTTVSLASTVTVRLPFLSVPASTALAVGALPTMHSEVGTLHPATGVSLATAVAMVLRLVVQASETLPVQATGSLGGTIVLSPTETVGLSTATALTVRLHVPGAESMPLGTQVTLHTLLYPQVSTGLTLGETLTLTGVLRLTSTSALSLETTTAFSVDLLSVQAGDVLALAGTSLRIAGLSLRGLHAATPVLHHGPMQGSLHQANGAEETLEQAEIDDAVLV